MASPTRENINVDCPDPDCMGWLCKVTSNFGTKLKCSDERCGRNCIFSKKVSECLLCEGVIQVGDVITHDDSHDSAYVKWVHINCFVNPPTKQIRTCERCGTSIENEEFVDDGTGYLHEKCIRKKRKLAMETGACLTPIRAPKAKKPIKVQSPATPETPESDNSDELATLLFNR